MTQDCVWGRTIGLPNDPPCSVPATQRMILVYAGEDHDVQVCPAHRNKIVEESKLLGLWPMMKDPDNWDESFNLHSHNHEEPQPTDHDHEHYHESFCMVVGAHSHIHGVNHHDVKPYES